MLNTHHTPSANQRITTTGSMLYEGGVDDFGSQFCQPVLNADFEPAAGVPFRVAAKLGIAGDHRSVRLTCTPGILRKRSGRDNRAATHRLVITAGNSCMLAIKDQTIRLEPGVAVILDGSCDFDLVLERDSEPCLLDWLHIVRGATGVLPSSEAFALINSRTIAAYIRFHIELMINGQRTELTSIAEVPSFDNLMDLIRTHLLEAAPPRAHHQDTFLYKQVKAHIAENLSSQNLSPTSIAQHFKISPRKLYGVFARMGASLRESIITMRLEAAHRELELGKKKVTTVLLNCGFSDASTFYRHYKKHFGRPPRSGRRRPAATGRRPEASSSDGP